MTTDPGRDLARASMELDDVKAMAAERAFQSLARSLALDGTIDIEGKSVDEVRVLVADWVRDNADNFEIHPVITHEKDLLEEARRQRDAGKLKFAVMFYATWIEHTLNGALHDFAEAQDLERDEYVALVRLSLREKMGVVWRLLTGADFPSGLRSSIFKIADERNSFVHYKWGPAPETSPDERASRSSAQLELAESIVAELSALVDDLTLGDNRAVAEWARGRGPDPV